MRLFKPNVSKMKEKKDITGLVKALGDKEEQVRYNAVLALMTLGDASVVNSLALALKDASSTVRVAAANAFAQNKKLQVSQAVMPLIEALGDDHGQVRRHAADALGAIGNPQSVNSLIKALSDCEYSSVRTSAANALGIIGDKRAVEPLINALIDVPIGDTWLMDAYISALGSIGDPQTIDLLMHEMSQKKSYHAVIALAKIGPLDNPAANACRTVITKDYNKAASFGPASVDPLIAALWKTRDEEDLKELASSLASTGDPRGARELINCCYSYELRYEFSAAWIVFEALTKYRSPDIIDIMVDTLHRKTFMHPMDPNRSSLWVENYLAQVKDREAFESLEKALNHDNPRVRSSCATALGNIGGEKAISLLTTAMQDKTHEVREAATKALENLSLPEEPSKTAWGSVAIEDWETLKSMGKAAIEPLITALRDRTMCSRYRAAEILGQIGDPRTAVALLDALNDPMGKVRQASAEALLMFYRSGILDQQTIQRILSSKNDISQPHEDKIEKTGSQSDCTEHHIDTGIGIVF